MEVSILLGSIRQERQSHRLAYYLENQLTAKGVPVNFIDLKNYPLPVFGVMISGEEEKKIEEINCLLKRSQAVLIVTPEYHSNISAALKNIMEYCGMNLIGKVAGVASASATKLGGVHASNILQTALLNLGSHLVSKRLLVPEIHQAFDPDNVPLHDEIRQQAEKFISELLFYTDLLKNKLSPASL